MSAWAADLLDAVRPALSAEERAMLAPLESAVAGGQSPAAFARSAWTEDPTPGAFLERVSY